ncbi:MAG TPA: GntR family transcriptional regulator [Nocardia sp.]|uniref:GntR family transcriptional regulator n=1 Tax=Nocardia TaxID=1817 RepID=UPI002453DF64|nr:MULTISPECIES: GntR family transcriptional regulator [Nocardia]HLS77361.1 GntR family transcriptional regulator [Nocardia sp.]
MPSNESGDHDPRPLSTRIYTDLRDRIIVGELPLGSRLRERELADIMGVSRVPLREALPQLEADGFITTALRRGASVTQLTMRDVEELFEVRLGVEVYATRLAARRVAEGADTSALLACLERAVEAVDRADDIAMTERNADLHEEIIRLAGNSLLSTMMRPVSGRDRWIFRMTAHRDPVVACKEHRELCEAIFAGQPDHAAALAYTHIERGRIPTLETLRQVLPDDRRSPGPES